jgi:tetratricopeptide (TPR) repeat protein
MSWEGYFSLGQVYEAQGDRQVAISAYQRVLVLNPNHENTKIRLSQLEP